MTTPQVSERALATATHLKKYGALYVAATVWVGMAMLFPTVRPTAQTAVGSTGAAGPSTESAAPGGGAPTGSRGGADAGAVDVTVSESDAGSEVAAGGGPGDPGTGGAAPADVPAAGLTRGGIECEPGVRQVPLSSYAAPCVPAWSGDNGGATYRGVTGDDILVIRRQSPDSANSAAVAAISQGAGFADAETSEAVRKVFLDYFNEVYELYGRIVRYEVFESTGDSTAEAQGQGIEAACADATAITRDIGAYAASGGSAPFAECAAQRELVVFSGAAYYPETFYRDHHPYIWGTTMECERISLQLAEYIGKRLLDRPAKWAGDAALQQQDRRFATYVPDNDGYQTCVRRTEEHLESEFGEAPGSRYNYQLDVSRFPDQAAQAIVQFKAAGSTTLVLACDPISVIFLTQAATNQEYRPEWLLLGVAGQDTDNFGRQYDQTQVNGHMFGLSQLGATDKVLGANSEPGRLYEFLTGQPIPAGTSGDYFGLIHTFNMLQAAGPNLTPHTMAAGAQQLPPGGAPDFAAGYWSLADGPDGTPGSGDHTQIDDSREIYWDGNRTSKADGKRGTFVETMGGRRFRNGEWPAEVPSVYPEGTP